MYEVGRVCMKIAGRDAGKICVVVDTIDEKNVLIDGQTRRRKCNISHLEATGKTVKISKKASNADVVKALKEVEIECEPKKEKNAKEQKQRPKKQKKVKKSETSEKTKEKKPKTEQKPLPKETKVAEKAKAPKPQHSEPKKE